MGEADQRGLRAAQEFHTEGNHQNATDGPLGVGVTVCFMCTDAIALYHEFRSRGLEASRPTVGAQALGIARAAYEYALAYSKEREQFGRKIVENQAIAFALADMKLEIDATRLLVWRASWMGRNGHTFENAEGSMSKLKAGEVAVWVTERAIQVLGGNGYTREFPVERWHRDAKIYDIFEGTAEIQQLVISRAISGMHIK